MTIYVDEIFAVNTFASAVLLYIYRFCGGVSAGRRRILGAAALSGLYAVCEAVLRLPHFMRVPAMALMVLAAFGRRLAVKNTVALMLVCACVSGITAAVMASFGVSARLAGGTVTVFASEPVTAAVYLLAYPVLIAARRIAARGRTRIVSVRYRGRRADFAALYDSGNLLRYRGRPVLFLDMKTASELTGLPDYESIAAAAEEAVAYSTVNGGGAAPVLGGAQIYVDGAARDAAAAVMNRTMRGSWGGIIGEVK